MDILPYVAERGGEDAKELKEMCVRLDSEQLEHARLNGSCPVLANKRASTEFTSCIERIHGQMISDEMNEFRRNICTSSVASRTSES